MFNKNDHPSSNNHHLGTIIGSGVRLTGTLEDKGPIAIHGQVQGEIISHHSVTIGEHAEVEGPIKGKTISIAGQVSGEVVAEDMLEITSTGKIDGSISSQILTIRPGAIFNGKCTMVKKPVSETRPKQENIPLPNKSSANNLGSAASEPISASTLNYEVEE